MHRIGVNLKDFFGAPFDFQETFLCHFNSVVGNSPVGLPVCLPVRLASAGRACTASFYAQVPIILIVVDTFFQFDF